MPQDKAKLDANLQQFEVALADTDKRVSAQLAPVRNKGYFVFHDAYTYFEKQYGLSPTGHFTVNPEIQPGAQRLHQIRTQLVEQKASHNSGQQSSMLSPAERRCVKARSIPWEQTSA
jgi:zinc transport system substrate-binding protein